MAALKSLVIGMGVLIVIGITVLGWGMYKKADDPNFKFFKSDEPTTASATPDIPQPKAAASIAADTPATPVKAIGDINLHLDAGCSIGSMTSDGNRLFLKIGPDRKCEKVIILDLATGATMGTIRVTP